MLRMSSKSSNEIEKIKVHLYDEPSVENLVLSELSSYLKEKIPFKKVNVRGPPVKDFKGSKEDLAEKFAKTRVRDPESPKMDFEPLYGEIRFEEDLIRDPSKKVSGVLYDGLRLSKIFQKLLPEDEMDFSHIHIIFTNRLFGVWDGADHRYHARVAVYGFPSIISTTGIVEAPAKPKEFYRKKHHRARLGQTAGVIDELKKEFEGDFVDYEDERLTEVMKGYVMQAVFYHLTSDPFCDNPHCRLYNAHWQKKLLQAQLGSPEFCERHEKTIKKWKGK